MKKISIILLAVYLLSAVAFFIIQMQPTNHWSFMAAWSDWKEHEHPFPCWLGDDNTLKFDLYDSGDYFKIAFRPYDYSFHREITTEEDAYQCGIKIARKCGVPLDTSYPRDGKIFEIYHDDTHKVWAICEYQKKHPPGIYVMELFNMLLSDDGSVLAISWI